MPANGEKGYISADSHIYEPDDMWTTRMEKRFRERAPHTKALEDADYFCLDGLPPAPTVGILGVAIQEKMAGAGEVTSVLRRNQECRPGAWDPQARLADQDLDHVRAEVLYPGAGLLLFSIPDAEYQRECMRVYNDWLADFCAAAPHRLIGTGLLPLRGPVEWAIAEAERAARIGWMAAMLRFMDHWWEDHRKWLQPKLEEKPSYYFHRQVWATFEDDRAGMQTRDLLNVDHLMWGSDYPHTEGTFPRSQQQIAHDFVGVPQTELRQIVWDNAAQLYGIEAV